VHAQDKKDNKIDCDGWNRIFSDKRVVKYLQLKSIQDSVFFVDTLKVFHCKQVTLNEQPVIFINHFTEDISHGDHSTAYLRNKTKKYIVLERFSNKKDKYILHFWEPLSNGTVSLYFFKDKKRPIEIVGYGAY
jgi:hypothetical protein